MIQTAQELLYHSLCAIIPNACRSSMFGVSCYKVHRKPFIMFYYNEIVCKLYGKEHTMALKLKGAKLFDPMNKGKPMKNWVHIPYTCKDKWEIFALKAFEFVQSEVSKSNLDK
jgi:hypothetical protein